MHQPVGLQEVWRGWGQKDAGRDVRVVRSDGGALFANGAIMMASTGGWSQVYNSFGPNDTTVQMRPPVQVRLAASATAAVVKKECTKRVYCRYTVSSI